MKISREQAAENRRRILAEAARLFRERGVSGVGVDAVAGAAGLTYGGLYSQFGSKDRLAVEALDHALTAGSDSAGDVATVEAYTDRYLSAAHRDRRGEGCPLAALACDMPRENPALRHRFTEGVRAMIDRLSGLRGDGNEDAAMGAVAILMGSLILARAVDDPALSERMLAAGRSALAAGGAGKR